MAMRSPLPGFIFQLHIQNIALDSTTCMLQQYAFKELDMKEIIRGFVQNYQLQEGCAWLVVAESSPFFDPGFKDRVAREANVAILKREPTIRMIRDD